MRIGITADANLQPTNIINLKLAYYVPKPLIDVLVKHDVIPVVIPILPAKLAVESLTGLDGLIIPGGVDIAPDFLGEEPSPNLGATYRARDETEFALVKAAAKKHLPILGICRGIQVINAALGGSIYQDLASQFPGKDLLQHKQRSLGNLPIHHVAIAKGSAFRKTLGARSFVNSRHHQAVRETAPGLKAVATAPDGVIEAVENDDASIQGIQWHPENLWQHDSTQEKIFTDFFARVKEG